MRRLLQSLGAEVIHLGHDRGVEELVEAALEEDADAIALSSYQGGHMEYFEFLVQRLAEVGLPHVRVYGGGGGTITPSEIEALHRIGVARIFSPEDGRVLGLEGMIATIVDECLEARVAQGRPQDVVQVHRQQVQEARRARGRPRQHGVQGVRGRPAFPNNRWIGISYLNLVI